LDCCSKVGEGLFEQRRSFMAKDQQGLEVTGTTASATALDLAIADYYSWKGDPVGILQAAAAEDAAFSLGHAATAALLLLGGFRGDHPAVVAALAAARAVTGRATSREKRHLDAACAWADGAIIRATDIWEDILLDHPTDALALRFAHDTYFYLGHSMSIRDSIARVLPAWEPGRPHYGHILGQYAFGLEEAGELRRAEEIGLQAIAINPEDGWAVHAVAHVLETESRQKEGIDFLRQSQPNWSKAQALSVHNGWHLALYLIEEGQFASVLADYDKHVAPKLRLDSLLDLVDAAALLWRLELAGANVGERWGPVAEQWLTHVDDHVLVFNDLHIALAVSRADDPGSIERLLTSMDAYVADGSGDNREFTRDVGRSLIDAVIAFATGDYRRTIELILPIRYKVIRIGGSHAQRDLVTQTLIVAAQRAGDWQLAQALLGERLAVRPTERVQRDYGHARTMTRSH
jgi:tetratricopeptide (TPR) repeat protein